MFFPASQVNWRRRRNLSPATSVRSGSISHQPATRAWSLLSLGPLRPRSTPRYVWSPPGGGPGLIIISLQITNELQQMIDYRKEYHIASDEAYPTTTTSTTTSTSTITTATTTTSSASALERSLIMVFFSVLFLGLWFSSYKKYSDLLINLIKKKKTHPV